MTQRTKGEGSIYQAGNGFVAAYSHGSGPDRVRKVFKAKTRPEAAAKLRAYMASLDGGAPMAPQPTKGGQTVAEHLDEWLAGLSGLKPQTVASYRMVVENYLKPEIGPVLVSKLTAKQVTGMMSALAERTSRRGKPLSARTLQLVKVTIKQALAGHPAVATMARVKGVGKGGRAKALSRSQMDALLASAEGHRIEALVKVALGTGLRIGELCALEWADVDLDAGTLTVSATVSRIAGQGLVCGTTKTESGERTVRLSGSVVSILTTHKETQSGRTDGHVFAASRRPYGALDPSNVSGTIARLAEQAGIGQHSAHDLRHTYATLALSADPRMLLEVSRNLGHSDIKVTANVYAKALADGERRNGRPVFDVLAG